MSQKQKFAKVLATNVSFKGNQVTLSYGDSKATVPAETIENVSPSVTYPGCVYVTIWEQSAPKWF
jgi:hypothetical protein